MKRKPYRLFFASLLCLLLLITVSFVKHTAFAHEGNNVSANETTLKHVVNLMVEYRFIEKEFSEEIAFDELPTVIAIRELRDNDLRFYLNVNEAFDIELSQPAYASLTIGEVHTVVNLILSDMELDKSLSVDKTLSSLQKQLYNSVLPTMRAVLVADDSVFSTEFIEEREWMIKEVQEGRSLFNISVAQSQQLESWCQSTLFQAGWPSVKPHSYTIPGGGTQGYAWDKMKQTLFGDCDLVVFYWQATNNASPNSILVWPTTTTALCVINKHTNPYLNTSHQFANQTAVMFGQNRVNQCGATNWDVTSGTRLGVMN